MSAALDRIIARMVTNSLNLDSVQDCDDANTDDSLSFGDWKDAISIELHAVKTAALELATELEYAGLYSATAKVRALVKDL